MDGHNCSSHSSPQKLFIISLSLPSDDASETKLYLHWSSVPIKSSRVKLNEFSLGLFTLPLHFTCADRASVGWRLLLFQVIKHSCVCVPCAALFWNDAKKRKNIHIFGEKRTNRNGTIVFFSPAISAKRKRVWNAERKTKNREWLEHLMCGNAWPPKTSICFVRKIVVSHVWTIYGHWPVRSLHSISWNRWKVSSSFCQLFGEMKVSRRPYNHICSAVHSRQSATFDMDWIEKLRDTDCRIGNQEAESIAHLFCLYFYCDWLVWTVKYMARTT